MDLKELETGVEPGEHWYYRTKKLPLLAYLRRVLASRGAPLDVVDVGSGSGWFAERVMDAGGKRLRDVRLIDTGYDVEDSMPDARIAGRVERRREPPARVRDSLVMMMDVLEHVPDDRAFLRGFAA